MKSNDFPQAIEGIPVLAKIWSEDDVWNICAFDIPVAAYGQTLKEARANFEEALECHFKALSHFKELSQVASDLRSKAEERAFYKDRIAHKTMVEDFGHQTIEYSPDLCPA